MRMRPRDAMVGLVPAAGRAKRLGPLVGSKELLPFDSTGSGEPRVVSDVLLSSLALAGVETALVVTRPDKQDLLEHYTRRSAVDLPRLSFVLTSGTPSLPHTIDCAVPFLSGRRVLFGFPDVVFRPLDVARLAADRLAESSASLVIATLPTDRPDKTDLVELSGDTVVRFLPRGHDGAKPLTWTIAAWEPEFTAHLHEFVTAFEQPNASRELHLNEVFDAALQNGMRIEAVRVDGALLDVGTPEDFERLALF